MNQNHKIRLHRLGIDESLLMSQTYTLCQFPKNPPCIIKAIDRVEYYSHDVKYGSGSGQQSVTGTTQQEDVNSHWLLKVTSIACAWWSELVILKIIKNILRVQNMMTCAKEGNQWLVVREFGWNISQPTGRTSPSCLASNIRLWSRQALKFVSVLPQTAPKKLQLVCVPGICTATISRRRSPTSRRSLPLASWVKEILEMCGRWVVTT